MVSVSVSPEIELHTSYTRSELTYSVENLMFLMRERGKRERERENKKDE